MNVEIIPGNNINLSKFYTNSDIKYKHFNILSSNLFPTP